jgi:hypothetical protein
MGVRVFEDTEGNRWRAWEVEGDRQVPLFSADTDHAWLWFESGGDKRRLPDPPTGWTEWPDEALDRLRHAAQPALPRQAEYR